MPEHSALKAILVVNSTPIFQRPVIIELMLRLSLKKRQLIGRFVTRKSEYRIREIPMIQRQIATKTFISVGFCLVSAWMVFAEQVNAQERRGFDPTQFLQRLDRNQNGMLEPDELSGRNKGFVEKYGFDTSRPVELKQIFKKINKDKVDAKNEASQTSDWQAARLVPGFGVDSEMKPIPGFGITPESGSGSTSSSTISKSKPSDNVTRQVEQVLESYDRNRDSILDAEEMKRANWGRPSPSESDSNNDGRLSKEELIARYQLREEAESQNRRSSENERDRNSRFSRSNSDSSDRSSRSSDRSSSRSNSSTRSDGNSTRSSAASKTPKPETTSSSSSSSDRIRQYVDQYLQRYDKNNDGKIDANEQQDMRRKLTGADQDGDNQLTRDELIKHFGGGGSSSPSTSSSSKTSESKDSESDDSESDSESNDRSSRDSRRSEKSSSSKSSSKPIPRNLNEMDSNGDGQVQMHEFTQDWDDETQKAFYSLDLNGDGVITAREFSQAKRK